MKKLIVLIILLFTGEMTHAAGWIQKADFGGVARHRTVMLTIGNKVYTGLGHYNGAGINVLFDDWWEYDPATNAWSQKADYGGGLNYHAAGFTIGNYGYVGTGRVSPTSNTLTTSFYRYDPVTNSWLQRASLPGVSRRGAVAFAVNGFGYLGTGETNTGDTNTFYRYDPVNDSWIAIANFPGGARNSAVAFAIEGYGYVGTGNGIGSQNDFWQYNPALNQWTQKADVGPTNRQEAVGFAVGGYGYIGTGDDFSSGNNFDDMWEYNVQNDTWTQIGDFSGTARRYLCAATFDDNIVYAGLGTSGTNFKDFWMFDRVLSVLEKNLEDVELTLGPNPAVDHIVLAVNGLDQELINHVSVQIHSLNGSIMYSGPLESNQVTFNTFNYGSGLYILNLTYNDHILKSIKFMIQ